MRDRLIVAVTLLASCGVPHSEPVGNDGGPLDIDGGADVGGVETDAGRDAGIDAPIDAPPDVPDTTAPALVSVSPGQGTAWLHAPIRFTFDEDLDPASVGDTTASAELGGQAVTANVTFEAPRTVVVTLAAATRGVGALDVHLASQVADAAGNVNDATIDVQLQIPAWSTIPVNRGSALGTPAYAVASDGTVYAAWRVASANGPRVVAAALVGSTWQELGDAFGDDISSVAVTLDENGSPLLAIADAGTARVLRWSGSTWVELASPGAGSQVALTTPAGGHPIVELVASGSVAVRELVSDAWQALGTDISLVAPVAGEPGIASPGPGEAVVGWIDTTDALRVYRLDGTSWTAFSPLTVSDGSQMSLAARGSSVAVAYDRWGGSFAVIAALANSGATAFTQLGKPLDIDIGGDARAPAIALDSNGTPIVAWTELVETNQRGAIAKWSGSAWSIVGGVTWLDSTTVVPSRTHLALGPGSSPVVASAAGGAIEIARFNGPKTPSLGIAARASIAGCSFDTASPPAQLSQTGCFDLSTAKRPVPHAGLVPYDIVAELWTDGAKKRRWIGLPDGGSMTLGSNGAWVAPVGTMIVKEFALETTPGKPSTRRPIETRFLVNTSTGWLGFSYRWNTSGTDASLQPDAVQNVGWTMDDGSTHMHQYPSRAHCHSCHYPAQGPLLGLRPEQLARWNDYDGTIADQLATLAALDVGPQTTPPAFTAPHDPTATWEKRMRGYMHSNCSHCHNPNYISIKDLRYTTALSQTKLCEVIVPGDPASSVVYQKVTSRPGMPPLGTLAVDPLAQELLGNWITGMTSCP